MRLSLNLMRKNDEKYVLNSHKLYIKGGMIKYPLNQIFFKISNSQFGQKSNNHFRWKMTMELCTPLVVLEGEGTYDHHS